MGSQHHPTFITSSPLILTDVEKMVAWSLEEGGGEEGRSKGCRPPFLQEVHQETDPSWPPHLFPDHLSFGSRHLVRSVPAGVAAGGGPRQLPHPRHHLPHQPRDGDRWPDLKCLR